MTQGRRCRIRRPDEALVHPIGHIHRIPYEILGQIFMYAVSKLPFRNQRPTGLAMVCRKWHYVAMYPRLWGYIYINFRTREGLLRLYLMRSKSVPLELYIETPMFFDFLAGGAALVQRSVKDNILDIIFRESHRWKSLHIGGFHPEFVLNRLQDLKKASYSLPQLQSLTIDTLTGLLESPDKWGGSLWPGLRNVKFSMAGVPQTPIHHDFLKNSNITSLDMYVTTAASSAFDIFEILRCVPLLESLHLAYRGSPAEDKFKKVVPNFTNPKLSDVSLEGDLTWIYSFAGIITCAAASLRSLSFRMNRPIQYSERSLLPISLPVLPNLGQFSLQCHDLARYDALGGFCRFAEPPVLFEASFKQFGSREESVSHSPLLKWFLQEVLAGQEALQVLKIHNVFLGQDIIQMLIHLSRNLQTSRKLTLILHDCRLEDRIHQFLLANETSLAEFSEKQEEMQSVTFEALF